MGGEILKTVWVMSPEEVAAERAWIEGRIEEIGEETITNIALLAAEATPNAYAPYSRYEVGGAVLCVSGSTYSSANAETATYSGTVHGEAAAIKRAIDGGEYQKSGRRFLKAVAVSHKGASGDSWSGPCGRCLQDIVEHCDNALILVVDDQGEIVHTTSLRMLMPRPFTPTHLGIE